MGLLINETGYSIVYLKKRKIYLLLSSTMEMNIVDVDKYALFHTAQWVSLEYK